MGRVRSRGSGGETSRNLRPISRQYPPVRPAHAASGEADAARRSASAIHAGRLHDELRAAEFRVSSCVIGRGQW